MIVIPAKALHHVMYRAKARLGARLSGARLSAKPREAWAGIQCYQGTIKSLDTGFHR
jgi:hypothetical protein